MMPHHPQKKILETDFPAIFQQADKDSVQSKKYFLAWNPISFAALTVAALLSALKMWASKPGPLRLACWQGRIACVNDIFVQEMPTRKAVVQIQTSRLSREDVVVGAT